MIEIELFQDSRLSMWRIDYYGEEFLVGSEGWGKEDGVD